MRYYLFISRKYSFTSSIIFRPLSGDTIYRFIAKSVNSTTDFKIKDKFYFTPYYPLFALSH